MSRLVLSDLASPRFGASPYRLYARLHAEAPVHRAKLFGRGTTWLAAVLWAIRNVLRHRDEVFPDWVWEDSLLSIAGPLPHHEATWERKSKLDILA